MVYRNIRTAIVGWLDKDEVDTIDNVAFTIARKVAEGRTGDIDVELIGQFNALAEKSEANFLEWMQA